MLRTEGTEIEGIATTNLVVLEGVVKAQPLLRELTDGLTTREFVVGTRLGGRIVNTPVVCPESLGASLGDGDRVLVFGSVRTRFFAAGGRTQSRTEVVATHVAGARSRAARTKALAEATAHLKTM